MDDVVGAAVDDDGDVEAAAGDEEAPRARADRLVGGAAAEREHVVGVTLAGETQPGAEERDERAGHGRRPQRVDHMEATHQRRAACSRGCAVPAQ